MAMEPASEAGCRAGLDWLGGTFGAEEKSAGKVLRVIERASGGRLRPRDWDLADRENRHGWRQVWHGPGGAELWAEHPEHGVHLELPGQACELLGTVAVLGVAGRLHHASRLDVRLDDFGRRCDPADVWRRLVEKDAGVVTRTRAARYMQDLASGGRTVYIGSPTSDRRLRVYDKNAESAGAIDAIRWELQLRRDAAEATRRALCGVMECGNEDRWEREAVGQGPSRRRSEVREVISFKQVVHIVCGTLRGFIDFRTARGVRDNVERWEREAWWSELTAGAAIVRMAIPDDRSAVERRGAQLRWCGSIILAVIAILDGNVMDVAVVARSARSRFKKRHRRIAAGEAA